MFSISIGLGPRFSEYALLVPLNPLALSIPDLINALSTISAIWDSTVILAGLAFNTSSLTIGLRPAQKRSNFSCSSIPVISITRFKNWLRYADTLVLCIIFRNLPRNLCTASWSMISALTLAIKLAYWAETWPPCTIMNHQWAAGSLMNDDDGEILAFSSGGTCELFSRRRYNYILTWYNQVLTVTAFLWLSKNSGLFGFIVAMPQIRDWSARSRTGFKRWFNQ